jgi:hypothetical protein
VTYYPHGDNAKAIRDLSEALRPEFARANSG